MIFSQLWRFISPGLYRHEKRVVVPFVTLSTLFFLSGAAFGYYVVFPPAFQFLVGYNSDYLVSLPGVNEYFDLAVRLLLAFGAIFEMPLLFTFLAKAGLVTAELLTRHRKYAILLDFVVAAILTPTPDAVNQLMMALPLMLLYEVSIVAIRLFGRKPFTGFDGEGELE